MNIQGDGPFIFPEQIDQLVVFMQKRTTLGVATMAKSITDLSMIEDSNVVKVVTDEKDQALYFSRSPIPYNRDTMVPSIYKKHIGLYIFQSNVLQQVTKLEPHPLEKIEGFSR